MDTSSWIQAGATVVLVMITGAYVYLTKKTVDIAVRQLNLGSSPVIGIRLSGMGISKVFGPSRRNLSIGLNLTNVGNAPAIELLIDAEIILEYSTIQGEKVIPSWFEPTPIPFLRPGEEISEEDRCSPGFGNTCLTHMFDDFREYTRLNLHRIATSPSKAAYNFSRLRVYVYYRSNIGQFFESTYETYLGLKEIPEDNETAELFQVYIPRPKFHASPISKENVDKGVSQRNKKRDLSGW